MSTLDVHSVVRDNQHSTTSTPMHVDTTAPTAANDVGDNDASTQILQLFQTIPPTSRTLSRLTHLVTTGELRDHDQLFTDRRFYKAIVHLLQWAWRQYDAVHVGLTSQSEAFSYQQEAAQPQQSASEANNTPPLDTWQTLNTIYTLIARVLTFTEFDVKVANSSFAFDTHFVSQLIDRFEPRFKRPTPPVNHAPSSTDASGHAHQSHTDNTLTAGRSALLTHKLQDSNNSAANANGKDRTPIGTALANVPASILASVGIMNVGIKQSEPSSPSAAELTVLRALTHQIYAKFIALRQPIRAAIGAFFTRFVKSPQWSTGIPELLAVYGAMIRGLKQPLKPRHADLLYRYILPLHSPNTTVNELQPIITNYHEQLVYVVTQYLDKQPDLIVPTIQRLVTYWPTTRSANSNKEVLFLHELEKLLEFSDAQTFAIVFKLIVPYLISAITSYQHRIAERGLQLWQNDKFVTMCRENSSLVIPTLTPVLLGEKHWNKSVNKMVGNVLQLFLDIDRDTFVTVAHSVTQAESPAASLQTVQQRIKELLPLEHNRVTSETEKLLATQAIVPQQLTDLNYYDFVFGHVLGDGSFSQVRYARRILKGKAAADLSQSQWPEYAVKIISKSAMATNNQVERNVNREIAIMNALQHPNITRLICVCRNPTNLYLVQEYASGGDLHTLIAGHGSLNLSNAVFIAAETLLALEYIHQQGYVYADMKPENVLIFSSGHVKIADFGSARPRDGVKPGDRVEGTLEYLAPEVASNSQPISLGSDLWAWACVLYQMLAGRTPVLSDDDTDILARKQQQMEASHQHDVELETDDDVDLGVKPVRICAEANQHELASSPTAVEVTASERQAMLKKIINFQGLSDDSFPDNFPHQARSVIEHILVADPHQRLTNISAIKRDPLFEGIPWETLHTQPAPTISVGTISVADVDSKWSRRKNSIMWAPMPKQYVFTDSNWVLDPLPEDDAEGQAKDIGAGVGSSRRHETRRAEDFDTSNGTSEHEAHRPKTKQVLSGIAEGDVTMAAADDDDDGENSGEASELASDSLLAKLARSGRLNATTNQQQSVASASQHIPTARIALPPRIPQTGVPSLSGHRPKIPSSRQLGSGTGSSLLNRMMGKKGVVPEDTNGVNGSKTENGNT